MNSFILFICFFVLFSSFNSLIESKEICIAFVENRNRISSTYRRFYKGPTNEEEVPLDIIIDGYYWRLKFNKLSSNEYTLSFVDPSYRGIESPFFSGKKFMATCTRANKGIYMLDSKIEAWDECRAVIFTGNTEVSVGEIPNDDHQNEKELTAYRLIKSVTLDTYRPIEFAFEDTEEATIYKLVLLNYYNQSGKGWTETENLEPWRYFIYNENGVLRLSQDQPRKDYLKRYEAIRQLNKSVSPYEVIGIVPQRSDNKYGFIFLFLDQMKIRWCWTESTKLDKTKCGEEAHVLIDCTKHGTKQGSSVNFIIIVCIMVITIIAVGSLLLFAANRRANREFLLPQTLQSSRTSTKTTKSKVPKSTPSAKKPVPPKSPTGAKPVPSKSPTGAKPVPSKSPTVVNQKPNQKL